MLKVETKLTINEIIPKRKKLRLIDCPAGIYACSEDKDQKIFLLVVPPSSPSSQRGYFHICPTDQGMQALLGSIDRDIYSLLPGEVVTVTISDQGKVPHD